MNTMTLFLYILVMAGVTYFIRMVPLVAIRKKITNKFILSFLYYVPYAVLGAMTFPAVFSATGSVLSASVGVVVALVLAFMEKDLLIVAVFSTAAAFISDLIFGLVK